MSQMDHTAATLERLKEAPKPAPKSTTQPKEPDYKDFAKGRFV